MTERSRFWDGTVLGDAVAVGQSHLHDQFFRCVAGNTGDRSVVRGWRNELEVSGTSSPVSVAPGGAVVYGMFFDSDAAVSVSVSTPSSGFSRYDRIVLRRDWSTYTVRIARVVGVAAAIPVVPALTQGAGAIWETPLATVLVDDTGTITVTDVREYCALLSEWAANIVIAGMYAEGCITAEKRPDRARYEFCGYPEIEPDSANPATRVAGAYDYLQFADAAQNDAWAYFQVPDGVTTTQDIYLWSVPNVNGAGAGVENAQWDYNIYYGGEDAIPTLISGTTNVDQQARLNTTLYADAIYAGIPGIEGDVIAVQLSRDGVADSYNSAMRVIGLEMRWTADA